MPARSDGDVCDSISNHVEQVLEVDAGEPGQRQGSWLLLQSWDLTWSFWNDLRLPLPALARKDPNPLCVRAGGITCACLHQERSNKWRSSAVRRRQDEARRITSCPEDQLSFYSERS